MKLKQIKLLACDVNWIFSNGRIYIWQDKQPALQAIQKKLSVAVSETAAIGDDTSDLDTFQVPQFNICVQDDHPILAPQAHYKTGTKGGFGAISELCDLIFLTHGQLDTLHGASI
jgi:3-deoxy-D-manno-octulosonate 8-phosphate phosphatase (KDO 8-P phosphatase)